ncbi:MAG: ATP-binding protein, partial [Butyrivibrio sp.]|nr:ATP-binding protein [Butyrivibrio sp.]
PAEEREKLRIRLRDVVGRLVELAAHRGFYGNLWHDYLALLLVQNENTYSIAAERRGAVDGTVRELAMHDAAFFLKLFDEDLKALSNRLQVPELAAILDYHIDERPVAVYNKRIRDRIVHLADALGRCAAPDEFLEVLEEFYRDYGVGSFGLHKAFRVAEGDGIPDAAGEEHARIQPIRGIRHVRLEDLVGYEIAKAKLIENTEAFVAGRPANNCLLYGDAGTGKSSSIKALANEYFDRGLRIIELYKHQFRLLNDVIAQLKGRNYRFIIYMDDLSFEDFETEYKYLKAVIEGGLEKKPDNVLIYATSNRRHLIRESFNDKKSLSDDDIHKNDTVQEKLSLASRFGVSIYFGAPTPQEYQEIVRALAQRAKLDIPEEELVQGAIRWQMAHGGLSGRTAEQYINFLQSRGEE